MGKQRQLKEGRCMLHVSFNYPKEDNMERCLVYFALVLMIVMLGYGGFVFSQTQDSNDRVTLSCEETAKRRSVLPLPDDNGIPTDGKAP
jgi:hypothetical protein